MKENIYEWYSNLCCISERKIKYLIYYYEAWSCCIFNKSFIDGIDLTYCNNELNLKNIRNLEVEINQDSEWLLKSIWKTYGRKSDNELMVLIEYDLSRFFYKDVVRPKDMKEYYKSISCLYEY